MTKQKRNTHTPELKAKVALEAVRGIQTVNKIAQHFSVHPVQAHYACASALCAERPA